MTVNIIQMRAKIFPLLQYFKSKTGGTTAMKHTFELDGTPITFEASENDAETVRRVSSDLLGMRGFVNLDAEDIVSVLDGVKVISACEGTASGDDKVKHIWCKESHRRGSERGRYVLVGNLGCCVHN